MLIQIWYLNKKKTKFPSCVTMIFGDKKFAKPFLSYDVKKTNKLLVSPKMLTQNNAAIIFFLRKKKKTKNRALRDWNQE